MPTIIVHGGAGRVAEASIPARQAGCRTAAQAGWAILNRGGSAVDAVEAAVIALENDPLFNAGTGAVLGRDGSVETDAAIMDGATLDAGAVAAVSGIRNPIKLARQVMAQSPHVLLAAEGAARFAERLGVECCDPAELVVDEQRAQWEKTHGTVGCVAVDDEGLLAAATSTGGVFDKLAGRVGDSPVIGAGVYADESVAVSSTGDGECILRTVLARRVAEYWEHRQDCPIAAERAITFLERKTGGGAGLILVDRYGNVGYARNTGHMPVCSIIPGEVKVDL